MMGSKTGKVLSFDVRSKCCKVCEYHESRKETVPPHDCVCNYVGSSKSMEPDMAVTMAHQLEEDACPIGIVHADNDSTTTLKLKLDFPVSASIMKRNIVPFSSINQIVICDLI